MRTSFPRLAKFRPSNLKKLVPLPMLAAPVMTVVVAFATVGYYSAVSEPAVRSDRLQLQRQVTLYGSDDFSGDAGARPNPKLWSIQSGGGGWGNNEQQIYTDSPGNVRLDGAGHLIIEARRDGDQITSARISSQNRLEFKDGMIQARIKMPQGAGLHPAFWMLGTSISQVGYPDCGEIDIAEMVNSDGIAHAAVHGPWISASPRPDPSWKLSSELPVNEASIDPNAGGDGFHIYWLRKKAGSITIGVDDRAYGTFRKADIPDGAKWVQDLPFFIVLNLAVGGDWPGPVAPDALPAQMAVDWVRIYG